MNAKSPKKRACWCGKGKLKPFSPEYQLCNNCSTLVSRYGLSEDEVVVQSDESDYYGKSYWLDHQVEDFQLPSIEERAFSDLSGRCIYWLGHLLTHYLPPARILDVGCAHGSFVSLLRAAGFDAVGLELSPWVAEFAKKTFGIPMLVGRLEDQAIDAGSFDVIVLNDVLEHLPDPPRTLAACARLLHPDGCLVIQTPCYPELPYEHLTKVGSPFLQMMSEQMAQEHIHLFSKKSVSTLLQNCGLPEIAFDAPAFEYDMYLFAGRAPLPVRTAVERQQAMRRTPSGQIVDGLLSAWQHADLFRRTLENERNEVEAERKLYRERNAELERVAQSEKEVQNREMVEELAWYRQRCGPIGMIGPLGARIARWITLLGKCIPFHQAIRRPLQRRLGLTSKRD